ncbi:pantoate kinase [Candidatus Methanomassiliicoccus intestinalis]|uniref:pantoate kinase n=1 Tax=Candidatus Methanomassiliicoccus intestinalis TaxID=1406512 RepID=UPI0037DC19BD
MKITAFCPGHITGFFVPKKHHDDPLKSGSLGAGICVDKGAITTVTITEGKKNIESLVNGQPAPVTQTALDILLGDREYTIKSTTELQLPCGSGFGTSAAGALSATIALSSALSLTKESAIQAAHLAEITHNTGLGDVAAISKCGITYRVKEGVMPHGQIKQITGSPTITACVLAGQLSTANILTDPDLTKLITSAGEKCVEEMAINPTLDNLFKLSKKFTEESKLASAEVKNVLQMMKDIPSSMIMLGNSVFALGNQSEKLAPFGQVFVLNTDLQGPRVVTQRV